MNKRFVEGVAILTGTVIGAGVLGIPYVAVRAGFFTAMLVLAVVCFAMLTINLLLGEVTLRSSKKQQLVGYAENHLGSFGKWGMTISMIIGNYGAMIAYTLGVSASLALLFGGSQMLWVFVFYILMAWLVHGGLRALGTSEFGMEIVKFAIFAAIAGLLFTSPHFNPANLTGFSWNRIMLPFGVILFAMVGTSAIPEIREQFRKSAKTMRKVIIIGTVIPALLYAVFTAFVIGISGGLTTEVATIGLSSFVGPLGIFLLNIFAILAMTSSFVVLSFALKNMYWRDFRLHYTEAWALTMVVPLIAVLIGSSSFVRTLDIAGSFAGGLAGILVVMMHIAARKNQERSPEYKIKMHKVGYAALILLFLLGMVYQLMLIF